MDAIEFFPRSIDQIIDHYLDRRTYRDRPISTAEALKAIRAALPACNLTDRELIDTVAACAIRRGYNVAFDEPSDGLPPCAAAS